MLKLLLLPAFTALAVSAWACDGSGGGDSAVPTHQPSAADLFGKEEEPFEVAFTPAISVSDDYTVNMYWREANGVRRIDVVNVELADGSPNGTFMVEPTNGASKDLPGKKCRWSFTLKREFYAECDAYTGGLTLDEFTDTFLRLKDSWLESETASETLAGREAVCFDVEGLGNLPENFRRQKGRICLGIEPNVPLYMANDTKAVKFSATRVTAPLGPTEFQRDVPYKPDPDPTIVFGRDVPTVPAGSPYPTIESLKLPAEVEETVTAYASR